MIQSIIASMKRGLRLMQIHSHLSLVIVLLFVMPFTFLYVNSLFFDAAETNVNTALKQKVSTIHDSIGVLAPEFEVEQSLLPQLLQQYATSNPELQEILISKEVADGYLVLSSLFPERIGTVEDTNFLYQTAFSDSDKSLIFDAYDDGHREWHAVRKIKFNNAIYYVVTSHNLQNFDELLQKRQQNSYLALTVIFAFILMLAYWLARQIHWRSEAEKLQKNLEERNLFTNMIAHEFRAPLTAINGYSSFLADSKSISKDESKYVENIQVSTKRLLTLVNDFLEVARIQSGKLNLKKESIDLKIIFENVLQTLNSSATEKGLNLQHDLPPVPIHLFIDPNRLSQVLTNIVSNSIKYTDQGTITLTAESNPAYLTIRIKDTGTGISAADQKKLFAPFVRVGGVQDTKTVGTGLGMWITKQLVEILGGTIGVESIKGVGTHVVLTFKTKDIAS